jgi:DNA uptake protein ComE-like DNA-binding protein
MKIITLLTALLLTAPLALGFDTDSEVEGRVCDFLNSSTPAELVQVKGLGNVLTARIIAARPFKAPQEVLKVKGIGEVKAQSIYDFALTSWDK